MPFWNKSKRSVVPQYDKEQDKLKNNKFVSGSGHCLCQICGSTFGRVFQVKRVGKTACLACCRKLVIEVEKIIEPHKWVIVD